MAHVTPIDEEELPHAFLLCRLRLAHEPRQTADRRLHAQGQEIGIDALAEDFHDALPQRAGAQVVKLAAVRMKGESDVGIDQRYTLKGCDNMV